MQQKVPGQDRAREETEKTEGGVENRRPSKNLSIQMSTSELCHSALLRPGYTTNPSLINPSLLLTLEAGAFLRSKLIFTELTEKCSFGCLQCSLY